MKKTILRTGGFALFFFITLDALFIFFPTYFYWQGELPFPTDPEGIAGLVFLVAVIAFLTFTILINKIILTEEFLSTRDLVFSTVLPKVRIIRTDLRSIAGVFVGRENYVRGLLRDNESWRNERERFFRGYTGYFISGRRNNRSLARSLMVIFVILKTDGTVMILSAKPFSAAGFRKLLRQFQEYGVKTSVQQNILGKNS